MVCALRNTSPGDSAATRAASLYYNTYDDDDDDDDDDNNNNEDDWFTCPAWNKRWNCCVKRSSAPGKLPRDANWMAKPTLRTYDRGGMVR